MSFFADARKVRPSLPKLKYDVVVSKKNYYAFREADKFDSI